MDGDAHAAATGDAPALPGGWRHLALDALPREPWRNGAGWTRPVARDAGDGEPLWRVSIAELSQAARFSRFDGLDRTAVLVRGGPVRLRAPDRQWPLQAPGDLARFPGEWPLENTAPERDALIWNVMVARGRVTAEVDRHRAAVDVPAAAGPVLVWVLAGVWTIGAPERASQATLGAGATLATDTGLHGEAGAPSLALRPATPDAALLLTRLR